ncbi:hypothetical protein ACIZ1P_20735 [Pseudomonas guariconensis]|uniref:hypothetical protein n=1 Tax=Pseudomonas guariconensis TaxID=1288410 RepID=UPI003F68D7DD
MNLQITKGDAELFVDAGHFMSVVVALIDENANEDDTEGAPFLNGYRLSGLMSGLKLVAHSLSSRGEDLNELVWKEEEKEAQAALQRRKGQDNRTQSNVEGKCGTQRAA